MRGPGDIRSGSIASRRAVESNGDGGAFLPERVCQLVGPRRSRPDQPSSTDRRLARPQAQAGPPCRDATKLEGPAGAAARLPPNTLSITTTEKTATTESASTEASKLRPPRWFAAHSATGLIRRESCSIFDR
jgi:hypothetical protein